MNEFFTLIEENPDLASTLTAMIAVFISFVSILIAAISLWMQRNHNFKSVKPIAIIDFSDYEDLISVKIRNSGTGPLIISRFIAKNKSGQSAPNIINLMPDLSEGFYWDTYFENIENFSIIPSKSMNLIEFSGDMKNPAFCDQRDTIRMSLSEIELSLEYKDIYGRRMPENRKEMKWFARHLPEQDKKKISGKCVEND